MGRSWMHDRWSSSEKTLEKHFLEMLDHPICCAKCMQGQEQTMCLKTIQNDGLLASMSSLQQHWFSWFLLTNWQLKYERKSYIRNLQRGCCTKANPKLYFVCFSDKSPPPPPSYKKDRMTTLELFWNISIFQYFEWPLYWTEVPINSSWMTTRVKYTFHLFECINFPFTRPHKLLGMKFTSMKGDPIYTCGLKSPSLYFETVQL